MDKGKGASQYATYWIIVQKWNQNGEYDEIRDIGCGQKLLAEEMESYPIMDPHCLPYLLYYYLPRPTSFYHF